MRLKVFSCSSGVTNYCPHNDTVLSRMDLTESYKDVVPIALLNRYHWRETRNAAAILNATNPDQFNELIAALAGFAIDVDRDIKQAGGNESGTAATLNAAFRDKGWREGSFDIKVISTFKRLPYKGEAELSTDEAVTTSLSYLIDNVRGRVAVDVEWHAKDGNLDRDIAAYRSLYEAGFVDVACIITMNREEMRDWARDILGQDTTKFATSTTTNLAKAVPRLERGDGGGCPILLIAIGRNTI